MEILLFSHLHDTFSKHIICLIICLCCTMHILQQRQQLQSRTEQIITKLLNYLFSSSSSFMHCHIEPLLVQSLYIDMSFCCVPQVHIVELWVDFLLEISCIFPLTAVDINELLYLCRSKLAVCRPCYSYS